MLEGTLAPRADESASVPRAGGRGAQAERALTSVSVQLSILEGPELSHGWAVDAMCSRQGPFGEGRRARIVRAA